MAGNTEQKIKNLQFKRNKTIYSSLEELVNVVKDPAFLQKAEIAEMQDGELLMFRYKDLSDNIATCVGCVYNPDSATKEIHLEIGTDAIKQIIKDEVRAIGGPTVVPPDDKILSLDPNHILTAELNLVRSGDTLRLIGKHNLIISTITLPTSESGTGSTIDSLSFNWLPQEAKLQLIGDSNKVLSEVDFPFETMVQSSELTTDNKLKLVFNTTKGPQSVLVDLNKLKDIYTAGDSTISVTGNKISTKVSSKTTSLPITKETDGLWVNDAKLTETIDDLNSLKDKVNNLEVGSGSGTTYSAGDTTIDITGTTIKTKISKIATLLPLEKRQDGFYINDAWFTKTYKDVNILKNRVDGLENNSGSSYSSGDTVIDISGSNISAKVSTSTSKLPLKKKSDGLWVDDSDYTQTKQDLNSVAKRVSIIETSIKDDVVTETNTAALDAAANSISDSSVLRFYHTGDDTNLDVVVPRETPFLEYWDDGQSTDLCIAKYNSQDIREKIVDIVTKQDLTEELTLNKLTPILAQYHSIDYTNSEGIASNALSVYECKNDGELLLVPTDKTVLIRKSKYYNHNKTEHICLARSNSPQTGLSAGGDFLLFDSNPDIFKSLRKTIYNEKFYLGIDPSAGPVYTNELTGDNSILRVYADLLPDTSELWEFITSVNPQLRELTSQSESSFLKAPLPSRMVFKYYNDIYEVTKDNEIQALGDGLTYKDLLEYIDVYKLKINGQEIPSDLIDGYKGRIADSLDNFIRMGYIIKLTVV